VWPADLLAHDPHIPGRTPRPPDGAIFEIAHRAPAQTDPAGWTANEAYLLGFHLYRHGYFWEAHEVWEPVWMGAMPNSRERALMQGLIQLANGCLKLAMDRRRAALRLVAHADACLTEASNGGPARIMGVDVAGLRDESRTFYECIRTGDVQSPEALLADRPELRPITSQHNIASR